MRRGAVISGVGHAGFLALAIFGGHLLPETERAQLVLSEVEVISEADFMAAVSAAPAPVSDAPEQVVAPGEAPAAPVAPDAADAEVARAEPAAPVDTEAPAEPAVRPENALVPRVRPVPGEPPRPTIAEIPSPDEVAEQAAVPESPVSTEPVQPLASSPTPIVSPKPEAAPPVEPEPALAEQAPETPPEETEPEAVAEAQPDAPLDRAPREARLPVARPSERVAAAPATGPAEPARPAPEDAPETPAEAPKPAAPETPAETPARVAGQPAEQQPAAQPRPSGSTSRFAQAVSRGEKDALSVGIRRYFSYNGNRSDRSLSVTVEIRLDEGGRIVDGPTKIGAKGGDPAAQNALFQAGRRALLRAQAEGNEFAKLPRAKYEAWRVIHVTFSPEEIGFQS